MTEMVLCIAGFVFTIAMALDAMSSPFGTLVAKPMVIYLVSGDLQGLAHVARP